MAWSLRHWRVRPKLTAVLVVPAVAFLVLASLNLGSSVRNAHEFGQGAAVAEFGQQVTGLVHELQSERDLSAGFIGSGRPVPVKDGATKPGPPANGKPTATPIPPNVANALQKQQTAVNNALATYHTQQDKVLSDLNDQAKAKVESARVQLDSIGTLRNAVGRAQLTATAALGQYNTMIASLLDIDAEIGRGGGSLELTQEVTALNDLSRAKEAVSQVRAKLYKIAFAENFEFGEFQELSGLLAEQNAAIERFRTDASDSQRTLFDELVNGQAVLTVNRVQRAAVNRQQTANLQLDPEQWFNAATVRLQLMRTVESSLLASVVSEARTLRDDAQRSSITTGIVILAILLIAVLTSLLIARSMTRPLRRLRSSALDVAENRLPQAIQRLRGTDADPGEIGVEPIGIDSRDEIGEVARTFDAIHEVAIRLATEQAALRNNVNAMFVNLSRRSQSLVERQLKLIDELETGEQDPDQLSNLFKLDHLATRMRRNSENLLVLAGEDAGRRWGRPIPLVDVLRAATSEVEQYHRIQLTGVPDVEVMGHAVNHVVHLVAELLENATVFSSPESKVLVHSQRLSDGGSMIEIEDRGIGMTAQEISDANERLANPPVFDVSISRMMGLFVVGRLSQRHGITVRLRQSELGGVSAFVRLTNEVLANRFDQRGPEPVGADATRLPAAPGRQGGPNTPPSRLGPAADLPRRPLPTPGSLSGSPAALTGPALPSGPVFPALPPAGTNNSAENGSTPSGGSALPRRTPPGSGPNDRPSIDSFTSGSSSGPIFPGPGNTGPGNTGPNATNPNATNPGATGPGGLPRRPVQGGGQNGPSGPLSPPASPGSGPMGQGSMGSGPMGPGQRGATPMGAGPPNGPMPGGPMPGGASGPMSNGPMPSAPPVGGPAQTGPMHGGPVHGGPVPTGPMGGQPGPNGPRPAEPPVPAGRDGISSGSQPANTLASSFRSAPGRADEEIRLPIFEQLQSEWFRRRTPSSRSAPSQADSAAARPAPAPRQAPRPMAPPPMQQPMQQPMAPQPMQQRPPVPPPMPQQPPMSRPPMSAPRPPAQMPPPPVQQPPIQQPMQQPMQQPAQPAAAMPPGADPDTWQSPADEGWRAAERLLAPTTGGTTRAGLPMRVPQAHLMPGAAEIPPAPAPVQSATARSPEAVRSRLASYHQGVRRGRHADRRGDAADHDQPDVYAQTQEQT